MPQLRRNPKNVWPPPPPANETEAERNIRLEAEKEAKLVSDAIDQDLGQEREQREKAHAVKILLLGQAESGKSTILKNVQLHFAPKAFHAQAAAWRPVIHLNLVRSVNFVLNLLGITSPGSISFRESSKSLSDDLRRLCIRLAPLKQVEDTLTKQLGGNAASSLDAPGLAGTSGYHPARACEVSIRPGSGWKSLMKFRRSSTDTSTTPNSRETMDDIQSRRIIHACLHDIEALWADSTVQSCLKDQGILLQDQPGFFLSDVQRIAKDNYSPTPDDILRARVHTIGPEEHRITMETSLEYGKEWIIYDVGGSRTQRAAWAQFFDDVNVIIFLAPISAFDQTLSEDGTVNRLADSIDLWQSICSNKLLAPVEFILFLNKLDVLDTKLKAGVRFNKYVSSYKYQNETKPVAKYLLDQFTATQNRHSPRKRKVHAHLTCAVDTRATSAVLMRIREVFVLKFLSKSNLL